MNSTMYVNKHDPFFTAEKWNRSIEIADNFEQMISKLLGQKFKGVYKPFLKYDLKDYVWFNDKYYQITNSNNSDIDFLDFKNFKDVFYYNNDFYIGINSNKKVVLFNSNNVNQISDISFDKISYFDNTVIGLSEQNLYKILVEEKITIPLNYTFSRNINKVKHDKFQIYLVTNNTIEVGNNINNDITETIKLYETKNKIIDIAVNETQVLVLLNNNEVEIINKTNGKKEGFFIITQTLNIENVKTVSIDDYSYIVYDGFNKLLTFNKNKNMYTYYTFIQELNFSNLNSLTSGYNYIIATNESKVSKIVATRYNLSEIDIRTLITNKLASTQIDNIIEYIDFTKGQYETDNLKPIINKISAKNNVGIIINEKLQYNYNFSNKFLFFKLLLPKNTNEKILELKVNNKTINLEINKNSGLHYYGINLLKDHYVLMHYYDEIKDIEKIPYPISSSQENSITFLPIQNSYILSSLIIAENSNAIYLFDKFVNNEIVNFDIQPSVKSYPFSYVKTDENGNININIEDHSILKSTKGFKVNLSNDLNKNDNDVALNMSGANKLKKNIDDLLDKKQNKDDKGLPTQDKNIVGSITELFNTKLSIENFKKEKENISSSLQDHNDKIQNINNNLWKIKYKIIGNDSSYTDLNQMLEKGLFISQSSSNKFSHLPPGVNGAFELTITGISNSDNGYTTQLLKQYNSNQYWVRTQTNFDSSNSWTNWEKLVLNSDLTTSVNELKNEINSLKNKIGKSYIVDSGHNNNGYWRIYSDGYCEQWGVIYASGGNGKVNMPKSFNNTKYCVSGSHFMTYAIHGYGVKYIDGQNFEIYGHNYENSYTQHFSGNTNWKATGYIS